MAGMAKLDIGAIPSKFTHNLRGPSGGRRKVEFCPIPLIAQENLTTCLGSDTIMPRLRRNYGKYRHVR